MNFKKFTRHAFSLALAVMMMVGICSAMEIAQEAQETQPALASAAALSELTGGARADASADLAALLGVAPMAAADPLLGEDVTVYTYEAVEQENGLTSQATFYDLSAASSVSGTYGGGYTVNYTLAGKSLFKIYLYASFDVTPGCVNGNRSKSELWASSSVVTLSGSTIKYKGEKSAKCTATGTCDYNYQNKYTGEFKGTVICTDAGVVTGGSVTKTLG